MLGSQTTRLAIPALLALSLLAAACGSGSDAVSEPATDDVQTTDEVTTAPDDAEDSEESDGAEGQLEAAKTTWDAAGITSYSFEVRQICFCDGTDTVLVTVEDGEVVSAVSEPGGDIDQDQYSRLLTMPDLFDLVGDFTDADFVEVTFDDDDGHLLMLDTDPDNETYDDELAVIVENFTPADS